MNFKKFGRTANLFDKSNGSYNAYVDDAGTWRYVDTAKSVKILCTANTTYTLSVPENLSVFRIYEVSDALAEPPVQAAEIVRSSGIYKYTFTTASTTAAIIFQGSAGDFEEWFNGLMMNTGSTALPYQPYMDWTNIPHYIHNTSTDTITTPADIYANDTTATVGLKGNMEQASGMSPTTPIQPQECGDLTGNLFDDHNIITIAGLGDRYGVILPDGTYSIYNDTDNPVYYGVNDFQQRYLACEPHATATITLFNPSGNDAGFLMGLNPSSQGGCTIVSGSTPPSTYIPYGYKIPILNGSQTTNVYLGEVQSTRRIKKLVLDGTENWTYRSGDPGNVFFMYLPTAKTGEVAMSNAYPYYSGTDFVDMNDKEFSIIRSNLAIRNSNYQYESQFKAYLAQQYANGTPVTVWYVLANEETGIVNEPLRKIGDYADEVSGISIPTIAGANTLSVDTTLQPSEVTVNYKGWHPVADVYKRESGAWD